MGAAEAEVEVRGVVHRPLLQVGQDERPRVDERIAAGGKEKPDFQMAKAMMLGEAKRVAEGAAIADEVVADKPSNAAALNERCWFRGTMNVALDGAIKDCTKAIELDPRNAKAWTDRGRARFALKEYESALRDLSEAIRLEPSRKRTLQPMIEECLAKRGG